jgi:prepilin-type N-terminal cleavage/methylation domain-containing protein
MSRHAIDAARRARRARRDGQAAFTLIELMVVVTILGLLSAAVSVYMRPQRNVMDCANVVADLVREGARKAFARGPVRSDVVLALGTSQRTQITISGDYIRLSELVEGPIGSPTANWVQIKAVRVVQPDRQVTMTGWKSAAQVDDGTSGNAPAIDTNVNSFLINCRPDGRCDAGTIYFAGPNGSTARTVILPLGGAVLARRGL